MLYKLNEAKIKLTVHSRDVTDSESESESAEIRHFFRNPKRIGFEILAALCVCFKETFCTHA